MLKLISFKRPYLYLIVSIALLVLLSIFSLPSLSASFCAIGVDPDRCNSKVPNWIQSCKDCDSDSDNEWCNTTDCSATGKICVSGTCQTPLTCADNDGDGYGVCPNCGIANGCASDGNDCDNADSFINPGAAEICGNGKDDDCVGGDLVCSSLAASIISPANMSVFKKGDTVSFNSSASGGAPPYTYLWQYTSKICGATCAPPLFLIGSSPSVTKNDFNQGGYRIFLKVTDAIGSMVYTPVDPTIGIGGGPFIDICDLPTISITSPVNGTIFEELDTINFSGVFSTCFNSYSAVEWKSNINGLLASSSSVAVVSGTPPSYSSSFSTHNLSIGVHNITFTVADSIGSVVKSINITVTPPASVKTLVLSPQNNAPFSNGEAVVFDSQTVGGVSPYVYSWNSNVDGNIGNSKTFSKNNLSVGSHTVTLTVTDQQGKTGANSVNIYIASSSFNWRNKNGQNWMTPVKNQDGLGSCGSFAKIGVVEAKYNIQENNPALDKNLSEQDLVNCAGLPGTWTYIKNAGVAEEPCVPYKNPPVVGPCPAVCDDSSSKKLWKITDSFFASKAGIAQIKYDLINHGPLYVGINITSWSAITYTCSSANEEHYVVLVGYDDAQGVWIAKNSWGAGFEMNGYFYIKYGNCGLEKYHERIGNVIPPI